MHRDDSFDSLFIEVNTGAIYEDKI